MTAPALWTSDAMRDFLYRDRVHLSVYTKAMYGLALHKQQEWKAYCKSPVQKSTEQLTVR